MRLNKTSSQSGNVLIYTLIGIVLFAAVMFSLSKGSDNSTGIASKGNAKLQAQQILAYSDSLRNGVEKLLNKGCSETQIAFDHPSIWYTNPNAPPDKSCHVFAAQGANLKLLNPQNYGAEGFVFAGGCSFPGLGSSNGVAGRELAFSIKGISKETCVELNKMTNFTSGDPPALPYGCASPTYQGQFLVVGNMATGISGKTRGCVYGHSTGLAPGNGYSFFQVLIVR